MRGCGEQVNGNSSSSSSSRTAAAEAAAVEDDRAEVDRLALAIDVADDMEACFKVFDKDQDGYLNQAEFDLLCKALFRNEQGKVYPLDEDELKDVFDVFDTDANGLIDKKEFEMCWYKWIKACTRPKCALLVVDVQNDFITGSLNIRKCAARHDGHEVIAPINKLLDSVAFDSVFYSLDWHPANHVSFIDNLHLRELDESCQVRKDEVMVYDTVTFKGPPQVKQRLWPRHCVQDTWGAEIHADLKIVDKAVKVYKGTNPEVDSYSVFWDNNKLSETTLSAQLRERGITDIFVCGVAYDVCVGATAVDALVAGYRTILLDDCCRGVDLDDIERTKSVVGHMHGVIARSEQVENMVLGKDRRAELGYKLAMEIKKKRLKKIQERENKAKIEPEAQH